MLYLVTKASVGEFSLLAAVIGCTHPVTSLEFLPFSGSGRFGDFVNKLLDFSFFIVEIFSPCEMHPFSNITIRSCTLELRCMIVGLEGCCWLDVWHLCLVSLAWLKVGGVLVDVVAGGDEDEM